MGRSGGKKSWELSSESFYFLSEIKVILLAENKEVGRKNKDTANGKQQRGIAK